MNGFLWSYMFNPTSRSPRNLIKISNLFNINYLLFIMASVHVVFPLTCLVQ